MSISVVGRAQCTQATLNWDYVDYYYNSGVNIAPYGYSGGNYVTNAMEMTQKFAIGTTDVTFTTSSAGMAKGDNATHTGNITNYGGSDAQFTPTAAGQTITLTFGAVVTNASFTLYDVDDLQSLSVSAKNGSGTAIPVTTATQGGTTLVITGTANVPVITSSSATNQGNSSNSGTVTIAVAGPVKSITISVTTVGADATFWLSRVLACVTGSFPSNYNQTGLNEPLTGPNGNQPDYFLITPDNDSCYAVDPVTGKAYPIFGDPGNTYLNSLAYDPYNHILYYVSEDYPAGSTNKKLKKYDFNTGTISTVFNDITTALNIPTFDQSLEGAGAAFYNGSLYLGIEGGKFSSTVTRSSIIYRIDFDASLNPTGAAQVWAIPCYDQSSQPFLQDWADFIIKNGVVTNYSSAKNGTSNYSKSSYKDFDLMSGAITATHMNPGTSIYSGQSGMDWSGNLYTFFSNGVAMYNSAAGTNGTIKAITRAGGGSWPGGNGDASENFRPQMDFGDAPSSYDPVATSPAAHEMDTTVYLGTGFDREWVSKGQTSLANSDGFDDAIPYVTTYNPLAAAYLIQVSAYNHSGGNATICAWLDYNANGIFDAGEGITQTISSSTNLQSVYLYWPHVTSTLTNGQYTYLRIRITTAANNMTTANPTGWYNSGEVEDYRVPVNPYPLAVQNQNFDAQITAARTVKLTWSVQDESPNASYIIEKSNDSKEWTVLGGAQAKGQNTVASYEEMDHTPFAGFTYYRLRTLKKDGTTTTSSILRVDNKVNGFSMNIAPNPASDRASVYINTPGAASDCMMQVVNAQGMIVYEQKVQLSKGTNEVVLPVHTRLFAGRYIVRVINADQTYSQSLIVK